MGKRAARALRQAMRGYRKLSSGPDPSLIQRLNHELTQLPLGGCARVSRLVFAGSPEQMELTTRQLLLSTCGGLPLSAAILRSLAEPNAGVTAAMPGVWVARLRQEGLRVNAFASRMRFAIFVMKRIYPALRAIGSVILQREEPDIPRGIRYAQFADIASSNLPSQRPRKSYDVVTWYVEWAGRPEALDEIRHSVSEQPTRSWRGLILRYTRSLVPALAPAAKLRFAAWSVAAASIACLDALRGRWAGLLLLNEAAIARRVGLAPAESLAREYLFSLGKLIYRPLWTYVAEECGARVTLFNYAASFHGFKTRGREPFSETGFASSSWPRILMWSERYATFARGVLGDRSKVEVVPPIWFSDSDEELPHAPRPAVAVFDVTPTRRWRSVLHGLEIDYRTFEIGKQFLEDTHAVLQEQGLDMMWKRKRGFGATHDKRYIRFAQAFATRRGVLDVPPGVSAFRVVEQCVAAISMAFTSTGFIASTAGLPSVFFDPTGLLYKDDRGAQGLRVISSRDELAEWVATVLPRAAQRHDLPAASVGKR